MGSTWEPKMAVAAALREVSGVTVTVENGKLVALVSRERELVAPRLLREVLGERLGRLGRGVTLDELTRMVEWRVRG
jgi:hypothetical protein